MKKILVSCPKVLLEYLDVLAELNGLSRSATMTELLCIGLEHVKESEIMKEPEEDESEGESEDESESEESEEEED